ncbi:uncharacterized protein K452DRAFT_290709 [Aplosporella prunicola CBS 121167]|uniref:Actin-like ATPase domain-containing protein n=1 Tax=Aplosporella prunicola CBS 121167 TaxID=1176127 RepID=A0A6A6B5K9_9PEZI|nr:uncharacterized protein K452DRAFT_290709 [Aplosporella prunicola CBS 121167]KAF2138565.1 hypothetical protein K452DRAFT_290709 [Aplosporella prunicola CBS 121167]
MSSGGAPDLKSNRLSIGRARPSASVITSSNQPTSPNPASARSLSGLYGSGSSSFRSDEEHLVFEFGARFLRAGFAGESKPRCTRGFGPEDQRRVGDFRRWMPGFDSMRRKRKRGMDWGQEHELWRLNVREVDIGQVEDKIERAVREIVAQYLLLDHRPRRATVVVPSLLSRPLLSAMLSSVFQNLQAISITVLSSPVLHVVSAGLRSALVIDLGWAEATATAVYEYREIHHSSSIRAGKYLSEDVAKFLNDECKKARGDPEDLERPDRVSFEEAEDVMMRAVWVLSREEALERGNSEAKPAEVDPSIQIPLPAASPPLTLKVPFSRLAEPAESALFAGDCPAHELDDHDLPIPLLAYNALLSLPIDARKLCMGRIIITGGVSRVPGVKRRILSELEYLISHRGWDPVKRYGSATGKQEHERQARQSGHQRNSTTMDTLSPLPLATPVPKVTENIDEDSGEGEQDTDPERTPSSGSHASHIIEEPQLSPMLPASQRSQEDDPISSKLHYHATKHLKPSVEGRVRGVESLGAWTGASLVSSLRIKGIVEIDKERFLSHGLTGASREDRSVMPQRQSSLGVPSGGRAGDRGSWTLGVWA